MALCGDRWEADEIAQETFVIAIESMHRFRGEARMETWLYGICLRVQRSRFRAAARYARRLAQHAAQRTQHEQDAGRPEVRQSDIQPLWAAVRQLPRKQREVVTLRYAEDLSVAEIATVVGVPEGTVKSRLHHGLKTLRHRMAATKTCTPGGLLIAAAEGTVE